MSFSKRICLIFLSLILFSSFAESQIVFKGLPNYQIKSNDSLFFDISQTRKIISLDGAWHVYPTGEKSPQTASVSVPSVFEGNADLTFVKEFEISPDEYRNYTMVLHFLGLNYSADIYINNANIYRHTGGDFPFSLVLPKDILNYNGKNLLMVKLHYKLDSENTIPVKQRFLFPQSYGGIFRDVYIHLIPSISINNINISTDINFKRERATAKVSLKVLDKKVVADSLKQKKNYELSLRIISPDGKSISTSNEKFTIQKEEEKDFSKEIDIRNAEFWSPDNPQSYTLQAEVTLDNQTIDITNKSFPLYSLTSDSSSIYLNGQPYQLAGVTYIPSFDDHGNLANYSDMEKDIKIIKNLGFNTVRFAKCSPNPYYLQLCQKYGLLAFIELPLNGIPGVITEDQNFAVRCENYLHGFLDAYLKYPSVAAIGVGSSFLPNLDKNISLIEKLGADVKDRDNILTYCSFNSSNLTNIKNIDLFGIELFNSSPKNNLDNFLSAEHEFGKGKTFISGATYPVNMGKTDGYVNEFSYEAQAKYFSNLIDFAKKNSISGYFINTMFNYEGDFSPLVSGYNKKNIYNIGIVPENRSTETLSYKVIFSKLHHQESITIPIGSKKNDAPMEFIVFGILLAIFLGIIVNSGRKFREDATRALMRPYNFFADVRDQRIISGFQTIILALIISAVLALITSNILFYFRTSLEFDKILISTGSAKLTKMASYLSWHPLTSLLYLSAFYVVFLAVLTIVIKIASLFVRNIVFYSNIYFTTTWALLPCVLLIPVGIVLYRILVADVANFYIYLFLFIFICWVLYRLIKGIYVIFDVNPGGVYFYSILIVLLICASVVIYLQVRNSFLDYFFYTLKQF